MFSIFFTFLLFSSFAPALNSISFRANEFSASCSYNFTFKAEVFFVKLFCFIFHFILPFNPPLPSRGTKWALTRNFEENYSLRNFSCCRSLFKNELLGNYNWSNISPTLAVSFRNLHFRSIYSFNHCSEKAQSWTLLKYDWKSRCTSTAHRHNLMANRASKAMRL